LTQYKSNIIDTIKNSLANFNEESRSILIRETIRLRDLSSVRFEENRLTQGINSMMKNLDEIINNLEYYINLHQK